MTSHSNTVDHVAFALNYVKRGWPILPLRGKGPAIGKGVYGAKCDESFARQRFHGKGIGIRTGKISGIAVIDVDPRNGGDLTLSNLIAEHGALPETLESATGGGGTHIFFNYPNVKLRSNLGEGIDVKSDGGYVVAPPSIHPDSKQRYEWRNDCGIADMPQWMLDTLTQAPTKREALSETIPTGRRNSTLFEIGAALKKKGASRAKIDTKLLEENLIRCNPPLPDEDVHTIAASVSTFDASQSYKTRWQNAMMRDTGLSMYQRGVLMCLSLYMNADGKECWPAMPTLSIEFHLSRDALSRALKAGIERGWLDRYWRPKPKGAPEKRKFSYGYIAKMRGL